MNEWKNIPEDIENYLGFVYKITNVSTGKFYIGQRKYWKIDKLKRKIKPNKQERERLERYKLKDKNKYKLFKQQLKDKYKGRFKNICVKKETKWKEYWGSSPVLENDININSKEIFKREILINCKTQTDLSIHETNIQINYYLNDQWYMLYNEVINLRLRIRK
jgi:hypothetical protein